ncbi:MAG: Panacea domain-containing protein [Eubacterium sp.]
MAKERTQFCIECREETTYRIQPVSCRKCIKDKEYEFIISEAVCEKCGEAVNIPGLMDSNAQEVDRQYRLQEGIVSIDDIYDLMEIYKIGKAPLSLALGFGEITITRYLSGQVPSKEYSDIIRKALESPMFMIEKLNENIDKIGETAYKKAMNAAKEVEPLFALSEKMLLTISYIFKKAEEVTPLALQKMLYFIQGIYMVLFGVELFDEECEAWAHGPVFKDVYEVFKSFKYNPIDDTRFSMFQNRFNELSDNEKKVIDLVVESFGMYSGKTLELITHGETPWMDARINCLPGEPSNEIISKESIKKYFLEVAQKYQIDSVDGIKKYISSRLQIV